MTKSSCGKANKS